MAALLFTVHPIHTEAVSHTHIHIIIYVIVHVHVAVLYLDSQVLGDEMNQMIQLYLNVCIK